MNPTRTLSVDIAAPFPTVMSELESPLSHPTWATEFFAGEAESLEGGEVRVTVPRLGGECRMKIDARADFGLVDIYLAPIDAPFGKPLPVRVLENGGGATVLWTLTRFPGMPDDSFEAGCASMQKELTALKTKLEAGQ